MNSIFRNSEFRVVTIKLLLMQIAFVLIIFLFTGYELLSFNTEIINQNTALMGKIFSRHPDIAADIAASFTKEATGEEIELGEEILSRYGYTSNLSAYSQPVMNNLYAKFGLKLSVFVMMLFWPLFFIVKAEYGRMYSKVRQVSAAAGKVVDGDFTAVLPEETEGDFGILGLQFNQMAKRLKNTLQELKNDKIFLKNIISDISHQLKTPLSSLIMFNELLLNDREMPEDTKNEFLEKSRSQLERMEWLIISLLKMARLESGSIIFKNEPVLLAIPARRAAAALSSIAVQKKQSVIFTGDVDNVGFIGDEEWLAEALTNIIKNCMEHTGEKGTIEVGVSETPLFSRIFIKDNGEGIDEKDLPHIFQRFYRGSNSVKAESVGIGLALAKVIVEGQSGSISVSSKKGEGTEFTITFLKGVI